MSSRINNIKYTTIHFGHGEIHVTQVQVCKISSCCYHLILRLKTFSQFLSRKIIQFCFFIDSTEDPELDERLKDQNFWLAMLRLEYKKFHNFITHNLY